MQLDKKFLSSETQLTNLRPRKGVDFRLILKDKNSHVSDGKLKCDAFVILQQQLPTPAASQTQISSYTSLFAWNEVKQLYMHTRIHLYNVCVYAYIIQTYAYIRHIAVQQHHTIIQNKYK